MSFLCWYTTPPASRTTCCSQSYVANRLRSIALHEAGIESWCWSWDRGCVNYAASPATFSSRGRETSATDWPCCTTNCWARSGDGGCRRSGLRDGCQSRGNNQNTGECFHGGYRSVSEIGILESMRKGKGSQNTSLLMVVELKSTFCVSYRRILC
ncbi:hypothetical protein CPB83DRAFT_859786, partial [Crepidotus variabilis]